VEKESARAAVDASRGLVLAYADKLIISYFHANSGGQTESSLNVWGVDLPYLKSVEDRYSVDPPEQTWQYFLSYKDIGRIFSRFLSGNSLKRIEPQEKSPSGRVLHFLLCSDDKQVKVTGNSFRLKVGPVNMKSTICNVTPEKNGVTFRGTGYGHGVGMSQLGAQRMALEGFSSEDILKHYYKDVDILKISYL
jgi:stage II sporulation protein D